MENLHVGINTSQQERHRVTPAIALSNSQQDGIGLSRPNATSIPRSSRPDTSLAQSTYRVIDSDINALVTSPTSYQEQPSIARATQDSFQFHYNPLVLAGSSGTFPPLSSPSSSLLSASTGTGTGSGSGASQQGSSVNREGSLSRTRSLAINSAARQALLQQQRYQQQQHEQFLGLSNCYSNNSNPVDALAAAAPITLVTRAEITSSTNASAGSRGLASVLSQTSLGLMEEQQISTPIPTQHPRIAIPTPHQTVERHEHPVPNTSSQGEIQQQQQQQQQQLHQELHDEHPQEPLEPPPSYSSIVRVVIPDQESSEQPNSQQPFSAAQKKTGARTTIQFEDNRSPPLSSQRQQTNGRTFSGASVDSPLTRTGTVSSNAAVNANFLTHFVPKKSLDVLAQNPAPDNTHVGGGPGPAVLLAIGKTGQGKSSLLNRIMGTKELKASASVRAVTKGIAERTGWARFEDNRRFLVTVADTPGLADTEGDDEKNIPVLKEYINSVGSRIGVTAFLLVFKIDSSVDIIMTILKTFNEIMQDFPDVWENVILVFTGCDFRRDILATKQLLHRELKHQIKEHILDHLPPRPPPVNEDSFTSTTSSSPSSTRNSSTSTSSSPRSNRFPSRSATTSSDNADNDAGVPMVFLTTAENVCSFALGAGRCDCDEHSYYLRSCLKRLWYEARKMKRWLIETEDDDFSGHA
ncbi:hypothetical protein BGX26_011234 [Mortierella sp. AD094]|nr:hypothetical protein BGX26_011234 [Mortierella sp. AD094]